MFKLYLAFLEGYIEDRIQSLADKWQEQNPQHPMPYNVPELIKIFKDKRQQHKLDVNQFKTFDDFIDTIQKIHTGEITTKKQEKRQIRKGLPSLKEGIDYIEFHDLPEHVDEDIQVYAPLNHKASCAIGRQSNWCTAMEKDSSYWNTYTKQGVVFFYVMNPNYPAEEHRMIAVTVNPSGSRDYWDAKNAKKYEHIIETIIGIKGEWFNDHAHVIRKRMQEIERKKYEYSTPKEMIKVLETMRSDGDIEYQGIRSITSNMELAIEFDPAQAQNIFIRFKKSIDGKLPFKMSRVDGDLFANGIRLTSCEGLPKKVKGKLSLDNNALTTLEGCSKHVGEDFRIYENDLENLKHAPLFVGGSFNAGSYNPLKSIEGMPRHIKGVISFPINDLDNVDLSLIPSSGSRMLIVSTKFPDDEDDMMKKKMERFRPIKKNFPEGIKFFDSKHGRWYDLDPLFQDEDEE